MTEIGKTHQEANCCCPPSAAPARAQHKSGCLLCGKPLVYFSETRPLRCAICGKKADANCSCEDGHFVCDSCHESSSIAFFVPLLLASAEKDPLVLFEQVAALRQVHMHGPEHHVIVPCSGDCAERGGAPRLPGAGRRLRLLGRLRCGGGRRYLHEYSDRFQSRAQGRLDDPAAPRCRLPERDRRCRRSTLLQTHRPARHHARRRLHRGASRC